MKMKKQCSTCEFNFGGICGEYDTLYGYDGKITDDTKNCKHWEADLSYFTNMMKNAPHFLREQYDQGEISYQEFSDAYDDYNSGKGVSINLFDAIKIVYGLSMVDIAVLLNVSYGVVYRARKQGIPNKRRKQFAECLFIDSDLLDSVKTTDFDRLEKSKALFYKQSDINNRIHEMPQWKKDVAAAMQSQIRCPKNLAEEFARIDKLNWTNTMKMNNFTEAEKNLIKYMMRIEYDHKLCVGLDYSLDIGSKMHLKMTFKPTEKVCRYS